MKNLLLFSLLFFSQLLMGQTTISGVVVDEDQEPLIGATVSVKGQSGGAITDISGVYRLDVEDSNATLVFSYIGFTTQEIAIEGRSKIDVIMSAGLILNEVVFVGSRSAGRTKLTTAVPVDVIDVTELTRSSAQVNLNQILNYVAPSFTSNVQNISDGTDHIDPASLRGLGPDQVLVLINGKRRHTSSLVNVNGTFGRGNVGTDLNAIPSAAIARIEVLRDGAAAQYGSDAIAGVINIILREDVDALNVNVTTGAYFSENSNEQTGGVDGATTNISANYGIGLGDNGGFINFTGDFDIRDDFNRMKEWEGSIFHGLNAIERVARADGADISNLSLSQIQQYAQGVDFFSTDIKQGIANATSLDEIFGVPSGANSVAGLLSSLATNSAGDVTGISPLNFTDEELAARGLNRSDFNMRVGQSRLRGGRFFVNMAIPVDKNGTELYANAGLGKRAGNSAGFYRLPNQERTFTGAYINGFLPEINSKISDQSLSTGIRGQAKGWNVDFSNTYGKNSFLYEISNTSNASMLNATPTRFDAGGFSFTQNTTNLDLSRSFDVLEGLNVAFGAEHRFENYTIVAGELPSYAQYDVDGNPITNQIQTTRKDFFGRTRPGGSQVFPGFSPANEVSRDRSSVAGYLDLEADLTPEFLLGFAARFENYSDFGSTINFKGTARYKITEFVSIRAGANTGFRAPSLHQLNFNSTSTIFDQAGNPVEVGTFANDSRAAKLLGIPELTEETSTSVSAGFTGQIPEANLSFTIDGYLVNIKDRVVYTGQFGIDNDDSNPNNDTGSELDNLLRQSNASAASFFANAIDTESKGVDIVLTHATKIGESSRLKSSLAATFSETLQKGDINASDILIRAGLVNTYFPEDSKVYLERAVPRSKVTLSNSLSFSKFNIFLRNVYFGPVTEATTNVTLQQEFTHKIVTDLSFGYQVAEPLTITIGANNLLDIYPDRAKQDLDSATAGDQNNRSDGRFDWSRRAQQFGIGGRFLFARVAYTLK